MCMRSTTRRLRVAASAMPTSTSFSSSFVNWRLAAGCVASGVFAAATTSAALCYGGPRGQAHVQHPAYPEQAPQPTDAHESDLALPLMSLADVKQHTGADSLWVTYNGFVYDVTAFVNQHPGGKELLLTAGGLDLHHFFTHYKVHTKSDKAINFLDGMKIGRLSSFEAKLATDGTTAEAHVASRMRVLRSAHMRLVAVVALLPFFLLVRALIRLVGFAVPALGHLLADALPVVSVPGYGAARRVPAQQVLDAACGKTRKTRVAVVGGGIAGCGCAYALAKDGYEVTVFEARKTLSGNAHTFDWNVNGEIVKTCVSVTAWPANLYRNYVLLLKQLEVQTKPIFLSWFLNSKVEGHEGFLWAADASSPEGSLRKHFKSDFDSYGRALSLIDRVTKLMTFREGKPNSMYTLQTGLGPLNPVATYPLHHVARWFGVSQDWWDIVFTPHYTASFLTDKLDNMVAVTGPLIERCIPLLPDESNSCQNPPKCNTCETWANAGDGVREVFSKLTAKCTVKVSTRVVDVKPDVARGVHTVSDDAGGVAEFDRVVFACPSNAVGNMLKDHNWVEDAILAVPEYADDHHPGQGHMHAVMHNDASIIDARYRDDVVRRGSNYVEITKLPDGTYNIENTYNFGVQTPSLVDRTDRPPLLITHALGAGKTIDPSKIVGDGSHARAHPLYSGWNVAAMLSLRLAQGRRGIYYCSNYTTPGNCHDMSLNSGLNCARAIGAAYPFEGQDAEAELDFFRLGSLMGLN